MINKNQKNLEGFTELIDITPTLAMDWLSAVPEYQRKIDEKHVARITFAINNNEWRLNGATIVFNEKGELIDGQHRLTAIYKSGRTVKSLVVTGVNSQEATFATLGDSKSRQLADFIHTKHSTATAAVIRYLWFAEHKILYYGMGSKVTKNKVSPPIPELVKLSNKHALPISEIVDITHKVKRVTGTGAWNVFIIYWIKLYGTEEEKLKTIEFFNQVGTGENLEANMPSFCLRKRFLDTAGLAELPKKVKEALVLKCLNYHLIGQTIKMASWAPERENFPKLIHYVESE